MVLLSIGLSTALFFATLGLGAAIERLAIAQMRQFTGSTDLIMVNRYDELYVTTDSLLYISPESLKAVTGISYYAGQLQHYATVIPADGDRLYMQIIGGDFADFERFNPIVFADRHEGLNDFSGDKIIISRAFAEKHNYKTGDIMEMHFGKRTHAQMLIVGVAESTGIFLMELPDIGIVPMDFANEALNAGGLPNVIYIAASDKNQIDKLKQDIEAIYPRAAVEYAVNELLAASRANTAAMPFAVSSIFVVVMGLFIVITSFNLIFIERLPSLGAFRTVGCTKIRMTMINLSEALTFGLLGGVFGCLLGLAALNIIGGVYVPGVSGGVGVTFQINSIHLIFTVLFGAALTLIGALVPVIKISRIPLRNIILGDIIKHKKREASRSVITCALSAVVFAMSVHTPHFIKPGLTSFIVAVICMVLIIVASILLIQGVIKLIAILIGRRAGTFAALWIGIKNVTDNSKLLDIVRLITISVSCTVFMAVFTLSVSNTAREINTGFFNYDYMLIIRGARQDELDRLRAVEGVDDTLGYYTVFNQYVPSFNSFLSVLYGIEDEKYFDYVKTDFDNNTLAAIRGLDNGRNIILTTHLQRLFDINIGDEVTLNFYGEDYVYTVTGFVHSPNDGGVSGFISAGNIKSDGRQISFSRLYVRAAETPQAMANTRAEFLGRVLFMETIDDLLEESYNAFMRIFDVLTAYAVLATIIGVAGIFNNTFASFIERKRELAVMRSVGMSKSQLRRVMASEAVVIAVSGTLLSFAAAAGMLSVAPVMMGFMWHEKLIITYNPAIFGAAMLFIMACMSLAAFVSISRTSKMSIIEAIKYE